MIGPLFLGLVLSIGFEGILIFQGYAYWRTFHNTDSVLYQSMVYSLCLLELFHSIVTVQAGYWYLVTNFGKPEAQLNLVWSIIVELAITVVVSFIGRAFWISWLFSLSRRNWWLTSITSLFSLAQFILGILEVYEGIRSPLFSTIIDGKAGVISQMIAADLGDLIISIALSYYLRRYRGGIQKTELILDRILMFVVTRGFLTSGMGALQLISYIIWPNSFIFGIFHLIASKLYTNSLLATLNGRSYLARPLTSNANDTGTSFVINRHPSNSQGLALEDKRSDGHFSDMESSRHFLSSPTSSGTGTGTGTGTGIQTQTQTQPNWGELYPGTESMPTYHAQSRAI